MQKVISNKQHESTEGMNLREKILYTILAAAGITTAVIFGKKFVEKKVADKSESKTFVEGTPETLAKQIKMAFENDGYFGTDTKALRFVLQKIPNKVELDKVFKAYQKQYQSNMYKDMSSELQSTEYNEMMQIMQGKPEKIGLPPTQTQYSAWAKRLKAAFDKTYSFIPGTDEAAIKAVFIEIPTQNAFINVGKSYYKEYNANLITDLKSELEMWEYDDYMKIITSKPKG